ncbi:MAG: hypothetical protein AB2L17_10605 [Lentimicrobium sp.]
MKLYKYRLLTAIMAVTVIFSSCSKDGVDNDSQSTAVTNKTTQKLISFRQDMFSKSGGSMTSDSAEWHLEGLLNFEQANNTHEFIQVEFLYDTLTWPASNGVISYEGLQQVYATVNELARSMALQSGNPDYTFDVIDLQVIETGLKNGEQAVMVSLSGGLPGTIPTYMPFDATDYWESGGLQGKCDIYAGQFMGRDATTELEDHFRGPYTIPSYFVSIETIYARAFDNEATDNPYGDYMMWMENSNHSNHCLSPGELNYYLSKWDFIKNKYKPANKTYCSVDVFYDVAVGNWPDFYTYILKYGINIGSSPS